MKSDVKRASGMEAADEEAKEAAEALTESLAVETPEERARKWRSPSFARMRTSWRNADESQVVNAAKTVVHRRIINDFSDAYAIMNDLFDIVREPVLDAKGEPEVDAHGFKVWAKTPLGAYKEDFSKLTGKQKEHFFMAITTRLFAWEQIAADLWAESMYAKAVWEERFAIQYRQPVDDTVDGRNAYANEQAADEKYFALFTTHYSKRADAIVRVMNMLALRLRDALSGGYT
jgi:hypothetical protein